MCVYAVPGFFFLFFLCIRPTFYHGTSQQISLFLRFNLVNFVQFSAFFFVYFIFHFLITTVTVQLWRKQILPGNWSSSENIFRQSDDAPTLTYGERLKQNTKCWKWRKRRNRKWRMRKCWTKNSTAWMEKSLKSWRLGVAAVSVDISLPQFLRHLFSRRYHRCL